MVGHLRKPAGLTLVETVVLLIVLTLLATALTPPALKLVAARRRNATMKRLEALHRGIVGMPEDGYFGFLGDLGLVPANLAELIEAGRHPLYHMDNVGGVGMGWNGPYVQMTVSDATLDAFGRPFEMSRTVPGQIKSAGADGRFGTDEDLVYPPVPGPCFGAVHIEVVPKGSFAVRLHYSDGGSQRFLQADEPPFVFENIHLGPHAVQVFSLDEQGNMALVHERVIALVERTGLFMLEF